jgi:hypothetical protein
MLTCDLAVRPSALNPWVVDKAANMTSQNRIYGINQGRAMFMHMPVWQVLANH